jgi:hypothetical protein
VHVGRRQESSLHLILASNYTALPDVHNHVFVKYSGKL